MKKDPLLKEVWQIALYFNAANFLLFFFWICVCVCFKLLGYQDLSLINEFSLLYLR